MARTKRKNKMATTTTNNDDGADEYPYTKEPIRWYSSYKHDLPHIENYHAVFLGSENVLTHSPIIFLFGGTLSAVQCSKILILKLPAIQRNDEDVVAGEAIEREPLKWEEIIPNGISPQAREFPALSYDRKNQLIYLYGGHVNTLGHLDDLWSFDLKTRKWASIATSNVPFKRCGCLALYSNREKFYVYGGYCGSYLDDFHELDLETKEWKELKYRKEVPPLTVVTPNTYVSENGLTIFGGYNSNVYVSALHEFNFNTREWNTLAPRLLKTNGYSSHVKSICLRGANKPYLKGETFLILYEDDTLSRVFEYDKKEKNLTNYTIPKELQTQYETFRGRLIFELNDTTIVLLGVDGIYFMRVRPISASKDFEYFFGNLKEIKEAFSDISFNME